MRGVWPLSDFGWRRHGYRHEHRFRPRFAEAETLIKAHAQFGKLPEELTMYVDRPTCNACRGGNSTDKGLSLLADLYSVKELKIIDSYANKLLVRPGQATVRLP